MKTVCVKLTPTEYAALLDLALYHQFLSVSDCIRQAIGVLIVGRKAKRSTLEKMQLERNHHEPRKRKRSSLRFKDIQDGEELAHVHKPRRSQ